MQFESLLIIFIGLEIAMFNAIILYIARNSPGLKKESILNALIFGNLYQIVVGLEFYTKHFI